LGLGGWNRASPAGTSRLSRTGVCGRTQTPPRRPEAGPPYGSESITADNDTVGQAFSMTSARQEEHTSTSTRHRTSTRGRRAPARGAGRAPWRARARREGPTAAPVEGGEEGYGRGTRMGNGREGGEGRAPSPARARRERGGRHGGAGAPREARFVPRRVHWQRTSALSICRTTIVPGSPASASATSQWSRSSCSCAARRLNDSDPTFRNGTRVPPPPSRTKWTRLVSPLVLSGHVSSLLPY